MIGNNNYLLKINATIMEEKEQQIPIEENELYKKMVDEQMRLHPEIYQNNEL